MKLYNRELLQLAQDGPYLGQNCGTKATMPPKVDNRELKTASAFGSIVGNPVLTCSTLFTAQAAQTAQKKK